VSTTTHRRGHQATGLDPLPPKRKWRAITLATLLLVVAFWALLVGAVSTASDDAGRAGAPGAVIAFGLALLPFVFIVLAFASEHPAAPAAAAKAMALCLLVGIPVSALAADAVTGVVAGVGAGGVIALRADLRHARGPRVIAVVIATVYAFVLVRATGSSALLAAPIFPFTALGIADHVSEWRARRGDAA
jgi:hypothetical protein